MIFQFKKMNDKRNSSVCILLKQFLTELKNLYSDDAGFDTSYDDFTSLCREA